MGCGREQNNIKKTTNAGITWSTRTIATTTNLKSLFFIDHNTGWIGGGEKLFKTTNGGENWFIHSDNIGNSFYSIYFINMNTGWGVGSRSYGLNVGNIIKTTNGGQSWISQPINVEAALNSVFFTSPTEGWAVGDNGVIIKTNDNLVSSNELSNPVPYNFLLFQNYPNPFNPITKINYSLPNTQYTILKVYDVLGNEVTTLVNKKQNAGSYSVEFNGANYPSGIYYYKLSDGFQSEVKKMLLIK